MANKTEMAMSLGECLRINHSWEREKHTLNAIEQIRDNATLIRALEIVLKSMYVIAGVATLLHLIACIKAMRERRVSRKLYTLVLNRLITDMALIATVASIPTSVETSSGKSLLPLLFFLNLYAAAVTNTSLAILKLYAVAWPMHFRDKVHLRTCVKILVLSWITPIGVLVLALGLLLATPTQHRYAVNVAATRIFVSFPFDAYLLTLVIYVLTVTFIWRAHRTARALNERQRRNTRDRELARQRFRAPTMKLALHMANFAIFNAPLAAACSTAIFAFLIFDRLPVCLALSGRYILYELLNWMAVMSITIRILLDVLIGFGVNSAMRQSLLSMGNGLFTMQQSASAASSRPGTGSTAAT